MSTARVPRPPEVRLLLVEDVPVSAEIARAAMNEEGTPRFLHAHTETLADTRALLRRERFDVVLLDLGLPDSSGLETLDAVRLAAPELAVIALTALEFDDMALAALRRGADDYLYKGEFDRDSLVRSVLHSMERRRMLNALERTRQRSNLARGLRTLTRLSALRSTPIREDGTDAHDTPALREKDPKGFAKLAQEYGDLACDIDALENPAARADALWKLTGVLEERKAEPPDVVDLHTVALKRRLAGLSPDRAEQQADHGRRMLLDLMGLLARRYGARAAS